MSINSPKYERHAGVGQDLVTVVGSFALTTSGAVSTIKGKGFAVVKVAATTGQYTITPDRVYPDMISAVVTLESTTATDFTVQQGAYVVGTGALTVFVLDSDNVSGIPGVADLSGPKIHFVMHMVKYDIQK